MVQASSESLPTTDAEGQHLGTTQTLEVKPVQGNPMEVGLMDQAFMKMAWATNRNVTI